MTEMIRKKTLPLRIVLLFLTAAVFLPDVRGQEPNAAARAPGQNRPGQSAAARPRDKSRIRLRVRPLCRAMAL